jgi:hypothetical protein
MTFEINIPEALPPAGELGLCRKSIIVRRKYKRKPTPLPKIEWRKNTITI